MEDTGPEDYKDIPICLQAVGARQDDEHFLSVAAIVDSILSKGRDSEIETALYAAAHDDFRKKFGFEPVS